MPSIFSALFLSWEWRPEVVLALGVVGVIYGRGWWRLRQQGHRNLASGGRLAVYLSGLGVLGLALLSGIDPLADLLFSVHMVQHELLMMVAPPLLLLGNPFPILQCGLPGSLRRAVPRLLARGAAFRRILHRLATPGLAWALYVATLWLWHTPAAYDAALRNEWVHDLEHVSFFWTAILFWWHVTGAAPHIHDRMSHGLRIGYILAASVQNEILSVSIALAHQPLYSYYTTVPRMWGASVLGDQMLGGAIMWIPGGMMYVAAAVILLIGILDQEEKGTGRKAIDALQSLEQLT